MRSKTIKPNVDIEFLTRHMRVFVIDEPSDMEQLQLPFPLLPEDLEPELLARYQLEEKKLAEQEEENP